MTMEPAQQTTDEQRDERNRRLLEDSPRRRKEIALNQRLYEKKKDDFTQILDIDDR